MTLEQRVSANETAINQLMTIQEGVFELIREVKQVQVDQQVQMHQFQQQMHQFQQQMHQSVPAANASVPGTHGVYGPVQPARPVVCG